MGTGYNIHLWNFQGGFKWIDDRTSNRHKRDLEPSFSWSTVAWNKSGIRMLRAELWASQVSRLGLQWARTNCWFHCYGRGYSDSSSNAPTTMRAPSQQYRALYGGTNPCWQYSTSVTSFAKSGAIEKHPAELLQLHNTTWSTRIANPVIRGCWLLLGSSLPVFRWDEDRHVTVSRVSKIMFFRCPWKIRS